MGERQKLTGAERSARYRAAKRAQGLRLKQFWVPDLRNPKVLEELRRSVEIIKVSDRKSGIMDEIEAMNDELLNSLPPYDWDEEVQK